MSLAMTPGLTHYLIVAVILFCIGMTGVLIRRNVIILLMSIELMLNAADLVFIAFARYTGDMTGHAFIFFVMAVAAAEVTVGLAIVVMLFRDRKTIYIDLFKSLNR
jgi:NADH-quinone oxidoreductase subunit K